MAYINGKKVLSVIRTDYLNVDTTKLWENENPSSAFTGNDIELSNSSAFAYLIIGYKAHKDSGTITYKKISNTIGGGDSYIGELMTIAGSSSASASCSRAFGIVSATKITFGSGRYNNNGTTNLSNDYAIPVVVYGTNIL